MQPSSLFQLGYYSTDWIRDFYTQTAVWWGRNTDHDRYERTAQTIERLCGSGTKRILDLGSGPGGIAAAMADLGHTVVAVDFSERVRYAQELSQLPRKGSLTVLEADFYTVELEGYFDVVCCWQVFGLGSDMDQRRLLRRMAQDWLAPTGCVLMDVYNPARPIRDVGAEELLPPLVGVPESVEMMNRCYFDPVYCRWIDEWQPTAAPNKVLAQTVRCYTPVDFLLLLEGTGLALKRIEVEGEEVEVKTNRIVTSGPLMTAWTYLVQLVLDDEHAASPQGRSQ